MASVKPYKNIELIIKTHGSESRPRKVDLRAHNHKSAATVSIYTHNNGPCIYPYRTTIVLTNIA